MSVLQATGGISTDTLVDYVRSSHSQAEKLFDCPIDTYSPGGNWLMILMRHRIYLELICRWPYHTFPKSITNGDAIRLLLQSNVGFCCHHGEDGVLHGGAGLVDGQMMYFFLKLQCRCSPSNARVADLFGAGKFSHSSAESSVHTGNAAIWRSTGRDFSVRYAGT